MLGSGLVGGGVDDFDDGLAIDVADVDLAVVLGDLQAVEPEAVVFGVGEPRAGLALLCFDDGALDGIGQGGALAGDLLGDPDTAAGREGVRRDGRRVGLIGHLGD